MKILLLLISIYFLISEIILPFVSLIKVEKLRKNTIYYLSRYEYLISVVGLMGKGKTSLSVGIITYLTEIIGINLKKELEKTRTDLVDIDFSKFDKEFEKFFNENFIKNECFIFKTIDEFLKLKKVDGFFTDYLSVESVFLKLVMYLIRYYILNIRGILTFSKGYLFNRATKTEALMLDDTGLEMVNAIEVNNWQFELGVIYFDDEVQLLRGNMNSNSKVYKMSGITITFALIRNMSLGTTYRITTKQLSTDEEHHSRYLTGSTLDITKITPIFTSKKLRKMISSIDEIIKSRVKMYYCLLLWFQNLFKKKENKIDYSTWFKDYLKQDNIYRHLHHFFELINYYLYSKGYNLYNVRNYRKSDDVGKLNTKECIYYKDEMLLMPLNYVYGNYDTFEYFWRLIALEKHSKQVLYQNTSNVNHDLVNDLFLEMLLNFKERKEKIERK